MELQVDFVEFVEAPVVVEGFAVEVVQELVVGSVEELVEDSADQDQAAHQKMAWLPVVGFVEELVVEIHHLHRPACLHQDRLLFCLLILHLLVQKVLNFLKMD